MYLAGILCSLCYFCRYLCLKNSFSHPCSPAKLLLWLDPVTHTHAHMRTHVSLPKNSRWAGVENKRTNTETWNCVTKGESSFLNETAKPKLLREGPGSRDMHDDDLHRVKHHLWVILWVNMDIDLTFTFFFRFLNLLLERGEGREGERERTLM